MVLPLRVPPLLRALCVALGCGVGSAAAAPPEAARVLLVRQGDGWQAVDVARVPGPPSPSADGPVEVVDARGTVLARAPWAPLADHRSLILPTGGVAAPVAPEVVRLAVPWPDGAVDLRLHGEPLGVTARRHVDPPSADLTPLHRARPPEAALDLVLLAEGYQDADRDAFLADATVVVDHLLAIEPWSTYQDFVALYALFVPSVDRGIDAAQRVNELDTAFECAFGCAGIERLICCRERAVAEAVQEAAPWADGILVLANSDQYGGSGGQVYSTTSTGPELPQIAAHELGHTLVDLWDEYSYGMDAPERALVSPNCAAGSADPLPWTPWLGTDGVDAFAVCSYDDWVRPTDDACMMRSLQDRYCPVCREYLVRTLVAAGGPDVIDAVEPAEGTVVLDPDGTTTFAVRTGVPTVSREIRWTLDGVVLEHTGDTLDLPCTRGVTTLEVGVWDVTPWVRVAPTGLLDAARSWTLDATACPLAPPPPEARCGCDGDRGGLIGIVLLPLLLRRRRGA